MCIRDRSCSGRLGIDRGVRPGDMASDGEHHRTPPKASDVAAYASVYKENVSLMATGKSVAKNGSGVRLVVVESPSKAKTISGFLGDGYIVESSVGHIRDLPRGAADVPARYLSLIHIS